MFEHVLKHCLFHHKLDEDTLLIAFLAVRAIAIAVIMFLLYLFGALQAVGELLEPQRHGSLQLVAALIARERRRLRADNGAFVAALLLGLRDGDSTTAAVVSHNDAAVHRDVRFLLVVSVTGEGHELLL